MKGILITKDADGYSAKLEKMDEVSLPAGDVMVKILWSTYNYKDALAITGRSPVVRNFPLIPGIDFAGVVEQSSDERFAIGDEVILNGWGVGEKYWGGFAEKARVRGDWLLPKPQGLSLRQTMAIGTAGYTAMLCVLALENHGITPDKGDILVTGASGGVGSVAISILSKLGYNVVAVSGRAESEPYLKSLGASSVVNRSEFAGSGKPLAKERWAGAIDVVGSHTLANVCASVQYGGAVAACGLAGGMDFPSTVAPFILRGITLYGIDSVMCSRHVRQNAWERLARDLDLSKLDKMTEEIPLEDAIYAAEKLLDGKIQGRLVVNIAG